MSRLPFAVRRAFCAVGATLNSSCKLLQGIRVHAIHRASAGFPPLLPTVLPTGLDGGVVESWGSSINNTWEHNALHDNEGYAGLSLMFADDFTPSLTVRANVIYENNCAITTGNCATFMIKSVNLSVHDNIVADMNYTRIVEISPHVHFNRF
jgi:hypothetical protein